VLLGIPACAIVSLIGLGLSAGIFIVPLNALYQQRSPQGKKGRLLAFANVVNFGAVLVAGAVPFVLSRTLAIGSRGIVLAAALSTLAVTAYVLARLPNFLVRLVLYLLTNVIYRIEISGDEHIPRRGALFVANHVSWVDALLVGTASDRMIRFLMFRPYYEIPAFRWFFRRMRAIPIAAGDSKEKREESFAQAREEIRRGHVVCIFAEGAITRTGNLLRFRRGFEEIARDLDAPIVPVCLDGVWGSLFSWERGRLLFKWPRQLPFHVRVLFGAPLPGTAHAIEVRQAIQQLSVEAFRLRKARQRPLEEEFVRTARRFWRRSFLRDGAGRGLSFGQTLVRSVVLSRVLTAPRATERIGLVVRTDVPGAVATLAAMWAGRTPVPLDADAGATRLRAQIDAVGLDTVLVDPGLVDERGLAPALAGLETIDVQRAQASLAPNLGLRLRLRLAPMRSLLRHEDVDRVAAVVLSSSPHDGTPRGVELTHHNILSNMESLKQVFHISRDDRILGVLPFANAFGLFGTLLLPAVVGVPVVLHDDPHDLDTIARLSGEHGISLLPVRGEELARLIDRLSADDLRTLRHVVVRGGSLAPETAMRFAEKFGVEPLEGLGCPECAPLISLNVPNVVAEARGQTAQRPGTVGQPLPGIAVRIVDAAGCDLAPGGQGSLLVSGPNVMRGYVGDDPLTREVLRDGWYRTPFEAALDEDGFLKVEG
jgi:acyl-[acyl-carrier-protein]-phospholipid O-acyltransferase/long-chain-fatty-acid--[acyl-carrier-protein] ligase